MPENKVTWRMILKKMTEYGEGAIIQPISLQEEFNKSSGYIVTTFRRLHVWQYIKYADRKKRGWGGYVVTPSGFRKVKEFEGEGE